MKEFLNVIKDFYISLYWIVIGILIPSLIAVIPGFIALSNDKPIYMVLLLITIPIGLGIHNIVLTKYNNK